MAASDGHGASRHSLRILVVDDLRDTADSMARLLALWGHETRTAYDGASALAVLGQFSAEHRAARRGHAGHGRHYRSAIHARGKGQAAEADRRERFGGRAPSPAGSYRRIRRLSGKAGAGRNTKSSARRAAT